MNQAKGSVTLVGAGCGPGLLTAAGLRAVRQAEVLVYDDLIDPEILKEAPAGCERIYAGKRSGLHSMPQEETEHDADTAQMVGPVFFKRYSASYLDRNVRIEVWDVPMQGSDKMNRIVELSYETTDLEDAAADRDAFIRGLTQQGLLLQHDALKTQQVLDAFLGSAHSQA